MPLVDLDSSLQEGTSLALPISYSVVSPLFNEEANIEALYGRLVPVLDGLALGTWEIIFVDDGSRDRSWEQIRALHARDPRVTGLRFSRNFGHHVALTAGLDVSRGKRVVTMDSDLQDQPEEICTLAAKMDQGFDLVYAERKRRQHSILKRINSALFLSLLNWMVRVPYPITGAVFRMMDRRFVDDLCRLRECHRFYTGLTAWLGFRQASVPVEHGERHAGTNKYDLCKMLCLAADSITSFSTVPLYFVIYVGAIVTLLALLFGSYVVARYYMGGFPVMGWASLITAITFFGGATLFTLGVIGQYIARIFEQVKERPIYIIQEALGDITIPKQVGCRL
jgi:dolichol-phosphate mannosyltransferase